MSEVFAEAGAPEISQRLLNDSVTTGMLGKRC
jgi:hypothetical protein